MFAPHGPSCIQEKGPRVSGIQMPPWARRTAARWCTQGCCRCRHAKCSILCVCFPPQRFSQRQQAAGGGPQHTCGCAGLLSASARRRASSSDSFEGEPGSPWVPLASGAASPPSCARLSTPLMKLVVLLLAPAARSMSIVAKGLRASRRVGIAGVLFSCTGAAFPRLTPPELVRRASQKKGARTGPPLPQTSSGGADRC